MSTEKVIYSIGHSNHDQATFLKMLQTFDIEALEDIRAFTKSRKYPQFNDAQMREWLEEAGIEYRQDPELGGRRRPSNTVGRSLNAGWQNESFHNYADYTLTDAFKDGIHTLEKIAEEKRTAYMCAEHHPARCHRLIVSNYLVAKGWKVLHIMQNNKGDIITQEHRLGQWGAMPIIEDDGEVVYPENTD
ncbi:DUF488 family protein [Staphylococcus debuckii]|uniref:DUF488 domain-containing protein n=1 Tax=Staphylococcus debuckii TaxID=2044912 RepID=UPI000F4305BA|nr:DUF488 domain-containing protein [Staphylococcus debuckii]AYU54408.1 DUF488 domain-containing protein [Staphylococcus debuckii]